MTFVTFPDSGHFTADVGSIQPRKHVNGPLTCNQTCTLSQGLFKCLLTD